MRRMEEIAYDDLTNEKLDRPMTKTIVWDGTVYTWDVSQESNDKMNEHMRDYLGMGSTIEGDSIDSAVKSLTETVNGALSVEELLTAEEPLTDGLDVQPAETPTRSRGRQGKLTDEQVRDIRNLRGITSAKDLAEQHGVSVAVIYAVQNRDSYKHVK